MRMQSKNQYKLYDMLRYTDRLSDVITSDIRTTDAEALKIYDSC
jgi:hypothetical protein